MRQIKTIMGIDPGTNFTGYGVLDVSGNEPRCVVLGHINLSGYKDPYQKLRVIFERVSALVEQYRPDEVALESPFFGKNVQSMLKLGRAQGVAMAAALTNGLQVYEYAPRQIKQSITGNGAASKEQVAILLKSILKVEYTLQSLDATDGLAVAMCHYFNSTSILNRMSDSSKQNPIEEQIKKLSRKKSAGSSSWESFLAENPDREITSSREKKIVVGTKRGGDKEQEKGKQKKG